VILPPLSYLADVVIMRINKLWGAYKCDYIFYVQGFTIFIVIKLMNKLPNNVSDLSKNKVAIANNIELLNDLKELMQQ
jgi:large-conductance mechanosensitive channel